jgi:hypothetical protein
MSCHKFSVALWQSCSLTKKICVLNVLSVVYPREALCVCICFLWSSKPDSLGRTSGLMCFRSVAACCSSTETFEEVCLSEWQYERGKERSDHALSKNS